VFEFGEVVVFALEAAVAVAVVLFLWRWGRANNRFAVGALATTLGVLAWNLTLDRTAAWGFTDAVSRINLAWQDVGTGVVVYCSTSVAFGWISEPQEQANRVARAASLAGLTAMVLDVFLL
jgi:hypothetical protein